MKRFFTSFPFVITLLALGSLFCSLVVFVGYNYFVWGAYTRTNEWGDFGDFFGGVFGTIISFFTIYYVYRAFIQQKLESKQRETEYANELKRAKNEEEKREIENRFLKLLELHRLNVSEMKYGEGLSVISGRDVFQRLYTNFNNISDELSKAFPAILGEKKGRPLTTQMDALNVSYYLLAYGLMKDLPGIRDYRIREILKEYDPKKIDSFLLKVDDISLIPPIKGFLQCQSLLSHYYRHMYHIVQYIDKQKLLKDDEKYQYISILRAQLDPYEQVILFYNTICYLGKEWEFKHPEIEERLITKYNIIRNVFMSPGRHFEPHIFYPLVDFEYLSEDARTHVADMRKNAGLIYNKTLLGEK